MDRDELKTISMVVSKAHATACGVLTKLFPHLSFYVSPEGFISCWVKVNGSGSMGINLKYKINVGNLLTHQVEYLAELDNKVAVVSEHPTEFFYCTECGQVLPKSEFEENVFAGYYCKKCSQIPSVRNMINESHKAGFYD